MGPKGIGLGNIFSNFLWEKKKIIDFFNNFLYFPVKVVSKLFQNGPLTNALRAPVNWTLLLLVKDAT